RCGPPHQPRALLHPAHPDPLRRLHRRPPRDDHPRHRQRRTDRRRLRHPPLRGHQGPPQGPPPGRHPPRRPPLPVRGRHHPRHRARRLHHPRRRGQRPHLRRGQPALPPPARRAPHPPPPRRP